MVSQLGTSAKMGRRSIRHSAICNARSWWQSASLVRPRQQRHRRKYKRWQRQAPMHWWQLDLVGGVFLTVRRDARCSPASMTTPGSS
jgi:hypothetical protein